MEGEDQFKENCNLSRRLSGIVLLSLTWRPLPESVCRWRSFIQLTNYESGASRSERQPSLLTGLQYSAMEQCVELFHSAVPHTNFCPGQNVRGKLPTSLSTNPVSLFLSREGEQNE